LSIDPNAPTYYKKVIEDDLDNFELDIPVNLWTGGVATDIMPGNTGRVTLLGGSGKVLTVDNWFWEVTSPGGANPTFALGTTAETMEWEDTITITVDAGGLTGTVVSAHWGAIGTITWGVAFTPTTPFLPQFTVTNGGVVLAAGDTIVIEWVPFVPNSLVNQTLIPKLTAPAFRYNIRSNTIRTITVNTDMTASGVAPADQWMVIGPMELRGGYDGIYGIVDADYIAALDVATSPFNKLRGKNKGLVKLASPGKSATDVQKAGQVYAEYNAYEWRLEVPSAIVTEDACIAWVNTTVGRNDFSVVTFPSYAYVTDPDKPEQLKLISQLGAIMGAEAKIANDFFGYHRAEAGVLAPLIRIKKLPTSEELDDERLNPAGIGILKKVGANFVVWGDRTVSLDPGWRWKHQREQMSHYINVLRENFPWAIFEINDVESDMPVLTALTAFFVQEWEKRALNRDYPFKDACQIKMDGSINTAVTRAAGDKIVEAKLRLANVTERLIIRIGKAGVYESVG
jgi:hypothetical protein